MKYLVTGGAGFIGSAFVRLTLETRADAEPIKSQRLFAFTTNGSRPEDDKKET